MPFYLPRYLYGEPFTKNKTMRTAFCNRKNKQWDTKRWTVEEAAILKNGFINGKRIKLLAKEIGRSETAVNKFLSRSGIRGKCRGTYRRQVTLAKDGLKRFELRPEVRRRVYKNELQADFSDVVAYMKEHGHKISKAMQQYRLFHISADFTMDGKPVSEAKLLLLANKMRVEEGKPIFSVPYIFW
jgi:hypothetical protein